MVWKLIGKITAYDDHLTFEFKAGLEKEVQLYTGTITQALLRERLFVFENWKRLFEMIYYRNDNHHSRNPE